MMTLIWGIFIFVVISAMLMLVARNALRGG